MIFILEEISSHNIKLYSVCLQNTSLELRISNNAYISYLYLVLQDYVLSKSISLSNPFTFSSASTTKHHTIVTSLYRLITCERVASPGKQHAAVDNSSKSNQRIAPPVSLPIIFISSSYSSFLLSHFPRQISVWRKIYFSPTTIFLSLIAGKNE